MASVRGRTLGRSRTPDADIAAPFVAAADPLVMRLRRC